MIRAGIIGAAGYTGGELIRLLLIHPEVQLVLVHSVSQAGKSVDAVHPDLWGHSDLQFVDQIHSDLDVLYLCMGHGRSGDFLKQQNLSPNIKIIDLSNTFRLKENAAGFVYGLPELNKSQIVQSQKIANPGCFATAIQLALLPLAQADLLQDAVHIHALTGSTGAGQQARATTHFSWRDNNLSIYKAFEHQHLDEIQQSILQLSPNFQKPLNFLPMRGNFSRGIFASLYTEVNGSLEDMKHLYQSFYVDHPFVQLSPRNPSLKEVINTNRCLLYLEKHDRRLLIISMIDNLLKGACGQAVQNMNLQFGLLESTGLQLKASVF